MVMDCSRTAEGGYAHGGDVDGFASAYNIYPIR